MSNLSNSSRLLSLFISDTYQWRFLRWSKHTQESSEDRHNLRWAHIKTTSSRMHPGMHVILTFRAFQRRTIRITQDKLLKNISSFQTRNVYLAVSNVMYNQINSKFIYGLCCYDRSPQTGALLLRNHTVTAVSIMFVQRSAAIQSVTSLQSPTHVPW